MSKALSQWSDGAFNEDKRDGQSCMNYFGLTFRLFSVVSRIASLRPNGNKLR